MGAPAATAAATATTAHGPGTRPARNLVWRQFADELIKLYARPRTHIGFAAFLIFELLVLALLQLPKPRRDFARLLEDNGFLAEQFFTGPTLAVTIMAASVLFLSGLFLALVSGDIVAKEVEDGTMRMILNRPVPRLQVLLVKWVACLVYTFVLLAYIGITSVLVACLYRGWGSLFVWLPLSGVFSVFPPWEGLARIALSVFWLALVLSTVSSLGFFCSCFRMRPAAATIVTLAVFFGDSVMSRIPAFEAYEHFFLAYHLESWSLTLQPMIAWPRLLESLCWLWAFNLSCFVLGALHFSTRDFKS